MARRAKQLGALWRWGVSTLTLTLALGWFASHWYAIVIELRHRSIGITGNGLSYSYYSWSSTPGIHFVSVPSQWALPLKAVWKRQPGNLLIWVPIWAPLAGLTALSTISWSLYTRSYFRWRAGCCKQCGYDCHGLPPGSPCPECGTSTAAAR